MVENADKSAVHILRNAGAPFVYFDNVSACGTLSGAIQLELTANALLMTGPNATRTEVVTVAHLRCSPGAAVELQTMIGRALEMLAKPQIPEGRAN